tara:strand:+ start:25800 stop:26048 length:249 start_codon:yes stop_codon:yes gene_type:complete
MKQLIKQLKEKEVETWKEFKNIETCFPIETRTEHQDHLIRESRMKWLIWSKAHIMALESIKKQIEAQIENFNNRVMIKNNNN